MDRLPGAVFVIDPRREKIAVHEARKLDIPVVAVVDTNCDPDEIDYVIPGNDDAIRAIRLMSARIADACLEGRQRHEEILSGEAEVEEKPVAEEVAEGKPSKPYVADLPKDKGAVAPAPPEVIVIRKEDEEQPAE